MTIEYDQKQVLDLNSWQVFTENKVSQPDPYAELKTVCRGLFLNATQNMFGNPTMDVQLKSISDPTVLADTIFRAIQSNRIETQEGNVLKMILNGNSSQEIITNLKGMKIMEGINPWDIMRQTAEFKVLHDATVLQAILGYDIQQI